jgi:type VI secretion system secreted protein VgrG
MAVLTQANQPIEIVTPLGKDALLLTSFRGQESLSNLFAFHVEMIADSKKDIAFDKILGQKVTIRLNMQTGKPRFFNGICNRFSQGEVDADFTAYHLEMVPQFWLLTKKAQTRIFQQKTVPDILKKVLEGLDVVYQIEGTFHPRNYCVQYRETDFNFASRLMEEEGIFYYFTHTADGHKMVLANSPASHADMPLNNKLAFEKGMSGNWVEDRIIKWEKQQELITGQHTVWDHKFEMHGKNLEAKKTVIESIAVGKATHKVKAGNADAREVYDYPGEYAQRFDGIDPGGGEQAGELNKILQDNQRVVAIRSQQEAMRSLTIHGTTTCRNLVSGHKFTLQKHANADGDYVLTSIQHHATTPIDYISGQQGDFRYINSITAIPFALPYRPQRVTPKPFVQGTQTAVVVGPPGEEIFCDKYGRVKVQFHWDREGKFDAKSSCWIRVSTNWAGKNWGQVNVPRIGHEVIVGFEEGDPDQPIIIGSVFNADHMPPGSLPDDKVVSGLKTNTTPGGGGYNGMIANDTKGKEKITVHAQYDMDTTVQHDDTVTIKTGNHKFTVETGTASYTVKSAVTEVFQATQSTTVEKTIDIKTNSDFIHVTSPTEIKLTVGSSTLTLTPDTIRLNSPHILLEGVTDIKLLSPLIALAADTEAKMGAPTVNVSGEKEATMGVGNQTVKCNTSQVAVAGAAIASSATGKHEITGAVVKIN